MRSFRKTVVLLAIMGALFAGGIAAQDGSDWSRLGITLKAGTLGGGADATLRLVNGVNLRAGITEGSFTYSSAYDGIDYEVDTTLQTGALMLDIHPFMNGFRLTVGAVQNGNNLTLTAEPNLVYEIGDQLYPAGSLLSLKGSVDFADVAPYVGIGFGNAAGPGRVSLSLDIGIMMHGNPRVSLQAFGPVTALPGFYTELAKETAKVEDDIKEYKYYPVVMIGLSISF